MKNSAFCVAALALIAADALAGPAIRVENNPPAEEQMIPYTGELPPCDHPFVFARISREFWARETEYWNSPLQMDSFVEVAETGYRPHGPSFIPRRYCKAKATFNDGVLRNVTYSIGENLGFIGISYGVTWCVAGLDRNHAFSPNCKAAGP